MLEWLAGSARFRAFAEVHRDKIRKKLRGATDAEALRDVRETLPRLHDTVHDRRQITLPTDGLLYEAELAHCSSCESLREAHLRIELEKARLQARRACLETERLAGEG